MKVKLHVHPLEDRVVPTIYSVGPGFLPTLGSVPWNSLQPGDQVQIHWQSQAYYEKIQLARSGTSSQHILITGVKGPQGQLPVIDGDQAHDAPAIYYAGSTSLDAYAVIAVTPHGDEGLNYRVRYLDIKYLEIRDGSSNYGFFDSSGTPYAFIDAASAVGMWYASNITVQYCTIHDCGNGIFGKSYGYSGNLNNVLIQGDTIYANGYAGDEHHHNIYLEGDHVTYQYNTILDPHGGSGIKDRSAGTIIRYNWIQGGEHMLDLVDPEDAPDLASKPEFQNTYVYGNVILDDGWYSMPIHFGGDSGVYSIYRPNLYFYNNTVVIQNNQNTIWRIDIFKAETNSQNLFVENNIFANYGNVSGVPLSDVRLMDTYGNLTLGTNLVPSYTGLGEDYFQGTVTGAGSLLYNDNPGFVDASTNNFHLTATSPAVKAAAPLDATATSNPVKSQYTPKLPYSKARTTTTDLGAFSYP